MVAMTTVTVAPPDDDEAAVSCASMRLLNTISNAIVSSLTLYAVAKEGFAISSVNVSGVTPEIAIVCLTLKLTTVSTSAGSTSGIAFSIALLRVAWVGIDSFALAISVVIVNLLVGFVGAAVGTGVGVTVGVDVGNTMIISVSLVSLAASRLQSAVIHCSRAEAILPPVDSMCASDSAVSKRAKARTDDSSRAIANSAAEQASKQARGLAL